MWVYDFALIIKFTCLLFFTNFCEKLNRIHFGLKNLVMRTFFLFCSLLLLSLSCFGQDDPNLTVDTSSLEKNKTDFFSQGLLGFGNAVSGQQSTKINPQTNIRSIRRSLYLGKTKTKKNKAFLYLRHPYCFSMES